MNYRNQRNGGVIKVQLYFPCIQSYRGPIRNDIRVIKEITGVCHMETSFAWVAVVRRKPEDDDQFPIRCVRKDKNTNDE